MKRRTVLKLLGAGSVGTAIVGIPTSIPTPATLPVSEILGWDLGSIGPIEAVVAWKKGWLYFTADGVFEVVDDEIIREIEPHVSLAPARLPDGC